MGELEAALDDYHAALRSCEKVGQGSRAHSGPGVSAAA